MGCERGEGLVCVWFIWEDCEGECCAFTGKASVTATKKNKAPVLPSSPPNESALVISEDDSDANETFHNAETISDKAHESMPPSQLSPCRTRVSGPNSSSNVRPPREPVRALVAGGGAVQTTATTAQSSLLAPSLGSGDRTSANFGTFRTTTTVATFVTASELSAHSRAGGRAGDSSSIAPPVSETSY